MSNISNRRNQNQPVTNPQQSLKDKIISSILNAMSVLSFFGVTGQDVTKWIINAIIWCVRWIFSSYHFLKWFFEYVVPIIQDYFYTWFS
jgi:hypothetical protein